MEANVETESMPLYINYKIIFAMKVMKLAKIFLSRPRLKPRPRLFLASMHLKTKTYIKVKNILKEFKKIGIHKTRISEKKCINLQFNN